MKKCSHREQISLIEFVFCPVFTGISSRNLDHQVTFKVLAFQVYGLVSEQIHSRLSRVGLVILLWGVVGTAVIKASKLQATDLKLSVYTTYFQSGLCYRIKCSSQRKNCSPMRAAMCVCTTERNVMELANCW